MSVSFLSEFVSVQNFFADIFLEFCLWEKHPVILTPADLLAFEISQWAFFVAVQEEFCIVVVGYCQACDIWHPDILTIYPVPALLDCIL